MGDELQFQFGKYVLVELVGHGATAAVYRAVQSGAMGFRKEVAIKKVLSTVVDRERVLKRLINEARISGYLHHRNLVEVYEFDRVEEAYYLAMEFVNGPTLCDIAARIPDRGPLPREVLAGLLLQICDGLAYAHGAVDEKGQPMNLVHRDIKPGNVMLSHDGLVKITDFGVAKATTNLFHTRAANITRGTPIYMSPEQVRGLRLDARSDIFSLGSLTVEMVSGSPMFQDTHLYRVLSKVDRAEVDRPLDEVERLMPGLAPILRQSLQRDPRDRFPSAAAMGRALRSAISPAFGQLELAAWLREWMGDGAGSPAAGAGGDPGEEGPQAHDSGPMAELELEVPDVEDTSDPTPLRAGDAGEESEPSYLVGAPSAPARAVPGGPAALFAEASALEQGEPSYLAQVPGLTPSYPSEEPPLSLAELDLGEVVRSLAVSANAIPAVVADGEVTLEEADDLADVATALDLPVLPGSNDADEEDDEPTLDDGDDEPEEPLVAGGLPVALAPVEPGRFWMGSVEVEVGRDADEELHEVHVTRPYLLGRVPVTQGQWAEVMGDPGTSEARELPVAGVTWFDAVDFCIRLSEREGLIPAYGFDGDRVRWDRTATGYRLPTEAEWEFAARAGEYTRFAGSDHADDVAWHRGNSGELMQPVARKRANSLGFHDLCGNVSEWVWDLYGPYPLGATEEDPEGAADGAFRVQRGGSVFSSAADVRTARRHIDGQPDESRPHVGFRLARSLS